MGLRPFNDFMSELPNYSEVLPDEIIERLLAYYDEYVKWQSILDRNLQTQGGNSNYRYSPEYGKDCLLAERSEKRVAEACRVVIENYKQRFEKNVSNI